VCFSYADDVNLMVALSSLGITIPAILGIWVLYEQATWNIILGIFCDLAGMIILSIEVNREVDGTDDCKKTTLDSIRCLVEKIKGLKGRQCYSSLP